MHHRIAAAVIALASTACTPAWVDRPTKARFQPGSDAFWDLPFPSDLRAQDDGSYGFRKWPGDWDSELVAMWLRAGDARVKDGWGLTSGVFLQTTGPIDAATLPGTPEASVAADASVFLVDVDAASPERGRRIPLEVTFLKDGDPYAEPNLIAATMVPGFVRRERTRYALVVTDGVKDTAGEPLGATDAFHAALHEDGGAYAFLKDEPGIDAAHVVDAAVFTTFDPSASLVKLAAWTEARPQPVLVEPWTVLDEGESFTLLAARFEVPVVQNGNRPYTNLGEGIIQWDGDAPVVQSTQRVRVSLAVPKTTAPGAGFPVTMYLHGSGGEYREGVDRGPLPEEAPGSEEGDGPPLTGPAEWLARRGIAVLSYDFPLHGDRSDPADTTGQLLYNVTGNVEATLDNYTVSSMELLLLSRLATVMTVPAGLIGDDEIAFDPARITAFGHSMGQTLGLRWATVDPRVQAIVLSGAGGGLVEVAMEAHSPYELKSVLEALLGFKDGVELHVQHPLLHAFQNVYDLVDPVSFAPHLVERPHAGKAPVPTFMGAGYRDGYFSPRAQAKLAGALGVPMAGDAVEPYVASVLELLGRAPVDFPVKHDLHGVTAAVVPYEGPFENGHFVLFDHEAGRYQYTCFLQSNGAVIPAPDALDAACPE